MKNKFVIDVIASVGEKITLMGWVQVVRDHGKLTFFDLWDSTGSVQCLGSGLPGISPQDVVRVVGTVAKRPEKLINEKVATGAYEVKVESLEILSSSETLPFDMGGVDLKLELPTLLDWRCLTLRYSKVRDIFFVQEAVAEGFRQSAQGLGCTEIFVPAVAASATEGGAEVFKVNYYGHPAYLTQSPQLYKQMMVPVFERVYTFAHAYRAEPSVTTRHLSESVQMDCEVGFVEFEDLLGIMEKVGVETIEFAQKKCGKVLAAFGVEKALTKNIPRLTLREAQKIIKKRSGVDHTKEDDLNSEDEREICRWAKEEKGSDLVTITHFPTKKRAFYTQPDSKDGKYSLSFDLLFKGMEVCSGALRVNDYRQLVKAIKDRGMDPKNFEMYLQAFRFGMPSEGGFSFGLERITQQLLELGNVREASPFPRDMERVDVRLSSLKGKK